MSSTFDQIRELIRQGSVRISDHGYDELSADGILAREAIEGVSSAVLVEIIRIIQKAHHLRTMPPILGGDHAVTEIAALAAECDISGGSFFHRCSPLG